MKKTSHHLPVIILLIFKKILFSDFLLFSAALHWDNSWCTPHNMTWKRTFNITRPTCIFKKIICRENVTNMCGDTSPFLFPLKIPVSKMDYIVQCRASNKLTFHSWHLHIRLDPHQLNKWHKRSVKVQNVTLINRSQFRMLWILRHKTKKLILKYNLHD